MSYTGNPTMSSNARSDAPVDPNAWKRAVHRAPPRKFCIEMLEPEKQGSNYSYGMRITPMTSRSSRTSLFKDDSRSISSSRSSNSSRTASSDGSMSDYTIWRRWEDCLWFQDTLEFEYSRMARAKRQRLLNGKGVKKNGIYIHDQAASFESLPNGPDPHSVLKDVHGFLPKLSKKGAIFRPSPAMIEQRHKDLTLLMETLWQDDVPALIEELREEQIIMDFFGYWRRDNDLAVKERERAMKAQRDRDGTSSKPRTSVTSSVFSMYFNPASQSTSQLPSPRSTLASDLPPSPKVTPGLFLQTSPEALRPRRGSSGTRPSRNTIESPTSTISHHSFLRPAPIKDYPESARSSTDSLSPDSSSRSSTPISSPVMMTQDVPIVFGHNPEYMTSGHASDRPISALESLVEELEPKTPSMTFVFEAGDEADDDDDDLPVPMRRPKKGDAPGAHRNARVFTPTSEAPSSPANSSPPSSSGYDSHRFSWGSTASIASSASSYLEGLDISLPKPHRESSHRQSICSLASMMTMDSADAILPRTPSSANSMRSGRRAVSESTPSVSIPEDGEWSDTDADSVLDAYVCNAFRMTSPSPRPAAPLGNPNPKQLTSFFPPGSDSRPSTALSNYTITAADVASTTSLLPPSGETLNIKAAHDRSIVSFRTPRNITFLDMRKRLYEKFVKQEGVPISQAFRLAYVLPPTIIQSDRVDPAKARSRSDSLTSMSSMASMGAIDLSQMRFVTSQVEWDMVVASVAGNKLTLRVLEPLS